MTTAYIRTTTGGFVLVSNTIRAADGITTYDVANDVRAADGVSLYTIFAAFTPEIYTHTPISVRGKLIDSSA